MGNVMIILVDLAYLVVHDDDAIVPVSCLLHLVS